MYRRWGLLLLAAAGLLIGRLGASADDKTTSGTLPLLISEDFEKGAARWEPTDPKAWKIVATDQGNVFSQFQQSQYKPPHRSPYNIALLKDVIVGDFVLEAKVQSTGRDNPHRDMCLFFGYQDPAHFYYVHLGKKTDDRANQIFIVNAADRTKISTKTTPGTNWTEGWHRVKITRNVQDGAMAIYFDDMKEPAMTATDKTFTWGRVGIGSFDDSGNWDDIKLYGIRVEAKK
ncbi:MAG: hypothetical protein ACK4RK_10455 [Gemmataceae bacterium]